MGSAFWVQGISLHEQGEKRTADGKRVSDQLFRSMTQPLPLLRGRLDFHPCHTTRGGVGGAGAGVEGEGTMRESGPTPARRHCPPPPTPCRAPTPPSSSFCLGSKPAPAFRAMLRLKEHCGWRHSGNPSSPAEERGNPVLGSPLFSHSLLASLLPFPSLLSLFNALPKVCAGSCGSSPVRDQPDISCPLFSSIGHKAPALALSLCGTELAFFCSRIRGRGRTGSQWREQITPLAPS